MHDVIRKRYHLIGLAVIVVVFSIMNSGIIQREEMSLYEKTIVLPYLDDCSNFIPSDQRSILKLYFFCFSEILFDDIKIIPILFSIGIIIMTFLFANKLTGKKYPGLIACGLLANLKIFYSYSPIVDTSGDWAFLLLLALYLAYKKPILVGMVLFVSLFAKGIGLVYIPIMIYMILNFNISNQSKKYAIISILSVIPVAAFYTFMVGNNILQTVVPFGFFPNHLDYNFFFWRVFDIREDEVLFLIFVPFVISGLYFLRKINKLAKPIIVLTVYTYLLIFLIPLLSEYDMGNHRMIIMVAFLSVGFSIIIHEFEPVLIKNYKRIKRYISLKYNNREL